METNNNKVEHVTYKITVPLKWVNWFTKSKFYVVLSSVCASIAAALGFHYGNCPKEEIKKSVTKETN